MDGERSFGPLGSRAPWRRDLDALEPEVRRRPYVLLLEQAGLPAKTWRDVARRLCRPGFRTERGDHVLTPIVARLRQTADPRLETILYYLSLPELARIHRYRREWLPNGEERWLFINECFVDAVGRLRRSSRTRHLGTKLLNDTANKLYHECRREWLRADRFELMEEADIDAARGPGEDGDLLQVDHTRDVSAAANKVWSAVNEGVISPSDAHLVLGTRLYGVDLREAARREDLSYETAKKRRQRAEHVLRSRSPKRSRKKLSPSAGETPLK